MALFEITYIDPETKEEEIEIIEFSVSKNPDISAEEWAEDYAYGRADKGQHSVRRMGGE